MEQWDLNTPVCTPAPRLPSPQDHKDKEDVHSNINVG